MTYQPPVFKEYICLGASFFSLYPEVKRDDSVREHHQKFWDQLEYAHTTHTTEEHSFKL